MSCPIFRICMTLALMKLQRQQNNIMDLEIQGSNHHGYSLEGLDFDTDAARLGILGIVRATGIRQSEWRMSGQGDDSRQYRKRVYTEEATVLDSTSFAAGKHIRLVIDGSVYYTEAPHRPLRAGMNYVVLGMPPADGRLWFAVYSRNLRNILRGDYVESRRAGEVSALQLFPTPANRLPSDGTIGERLLNGILDGFSASTGVDAARFAHFLDYSSFGGTPALSDPRKVNPDNPFTKRLRKIAHDSSDPFLRARAAEVLAGKHVTGSYALYIKALASVAKSPNGYFDPTEPLDNLTETLWGFNRQITPKAELDLVDQTLCNEVGLVSPPSKISEYFVVRLVYNPTSSQLARYAALLRTTTPKFADAVLASLPVWTGTTREQMVAKGVTDHDSEIAYWQKRLNVPVKP